MEQINVLSHQLTRIEVWQDLAKLDLIALHHGRHGFVHENDVVGGVGNHDAGTRLIQSIDHTGIGHCGILGRLQRLLNSVDGL